MCPPPLAGDRTGEIPVPTVRPPPLAGGQSPDERRQQNDRLSFLWLDSVDLYLTPEAVSRGFFLGSSSL